MHKLINQAIPPTMAHLLRQTDWQGLAGLSARQGGHIVVPTRNE
jgi:hypothetical protein